MQHLVTGLSFPYRGLSVKHPRSRCVAQSQGAKRLVSRYAALRHFFQLGDASGIEVRSTESRCEAPWIEGRSTEVFNLNWGDAQTWLGQFLVFA